MNKIGVWVLLSFLTGCIEPFSPPEAAVSDNFLVVEAYLDVASGESRVLLTRTQDLDAPDEAPVEIGAQVVIQTEGGQDFPLNEFGSGHYAASSVNLTVQDRCRLYIRLASGREYASEFVEVKQTPPIDSVTWDAQPNALNIRVTTHDDTGNARFYRWRIEETAQYYSTFASSYIYDAGMGEVRPRTPSEQIFSCWKTTPGAAIKVATSKGLASDIIDKFVLTSLDADSWKHKIRYSLNVRQYAISEEEYNYWNQLKKNTESVGTIFDPQPTQALGNIRSLAGSAEPVLGYFSASVERSTRIFISASQLPYDFYTTGYEGCGFQLDTIPIPEFNEAPTATLIIGEIYSMFGVPYAYTTSEDFCIDCRIVHGGTTVQPDFW